jgi:hypothetical protein
MGRQRATPLEYARPEPRPRRSGQMPRWLEVLEIVVIIVGPILMLIRAWLRNRL